MPRSSRVGHTCPSEAQPTNQRPRLGLPNYVTSSHSSKTSLSLSSKSLPQWRPFSRFSLPRRRISPSFLLSMASATALESPSQERSVPDTSAQPSSHLRGGAHGRGRGRGSGLLDGVRGAGRGRSRGRGNRGARGPDSGFLHSRQGSGHMNPLPGQSSRPQDRPTSNGEPAGSPGGKIGPVAEIKGAGAKEQDVEAEVCFICASNVIHNSVAPCNHRTCHICALRLRALYKTRACAHCRVCNHLSFCDQNPSLMNDRRKPNMSYSPMIRISVMRISPIQTSRRPMTS